MYKANYVFITAIIILGNITSVCGQNMGEPIEWAEYQALSIVHTAMLHFDEIKVSNSNWAIIRTQDGNYMTAFKAAIYNEVDELIVAENAKNVLWMYGRWQLLNIISGHLEINEGKYHCLMSQKQLPLVQMGNFILGKCTILCKVNLESNLIFRPGPIGKTVRTNYRGPKDFPSVPTIFWPYYIIPPGWEDHVGPAYERYGQISAIFKDERPEAEANLRNLLSDKNPFLALAAFRRLLELDKVAENELSSIFASISEYQTALFTYLWLTVISAKYPVEVRSSKVLFPIVANTKSEETLEKFLLGAYAAAIRKKASFKESQNLIKELLDALKSFPAPKHDPTRIRRWHFSAPIRWDFSKPDSYFVIYEDLPAAEPPEVKIWNE